MSSTPGRRSHSAAKRTQCANCACSWMRHVPDLARSPRVRCLTGVSLLNPRGTCDCTEYVEATVRRAKGGAR